MFVDVGDAKLFALRHGARDVASIVGVGGWIGSSELWAEPFALLSTRWSTIAYDHRGTGVSVVSTESITLDNLVEDVIRVMDAFGVDRATLAAESAGALTALLAAIAHPDRITNLVIVDGQYATAPTDGPTAFERGLEHQYVPTIRAFVEACLPEPREDHLVAWGDKILDRAEAADARALLTVGRGVDVRPRLGAVVQPTLVIHGSVDAIVPVASSEFLAASIPDADLVVIEGAGHVPTITHPNDVADAINAFLVAHS